MNAASVAQTLKTVCSKIGCDPNAWWESTLAEGKALGIEPGPNEDKLVFRKRVNSARRQQKVMN